MPSALNQKENTYSVKNVFSQTRYINVTLVSGPFGEGPPPQLSYLTILIAKIFTFYHEYVPQRPGLIFKCLFSVVTNDYVIVRYVH